MAVKGGAVEVLEAEGDAAFYARLVDGKAHASFTEVAGEGQKSHGGQFSAIAAIDQQQEEVTAHISYRKRWNAYIRDFLWRKAADPLLLLNASGRKIENISMLKLIGICLMSQSQNICYGAFFINFILSPSILSLVLPLSALLYALLDSPVPSTRYWKLLMFYTLSVVGVKFFYQFPIFCGTPSFSLISMTDGCPKIEVSE